MFENESYNLPWKKQQKVKIRETEWGNPMSDNLKSQMRGVGDGVITALRKASLSKAGQNE